MEFPKFLYLYTSRYHSNNVKCVLARENWLDKDLDVKYARYIQEYIKIRDILSSRNEEEVKLILDEHSLKRTNEAYQFIFRNLIDELKLNYTLSDDEYDEIKERLDPLRKDIFNFDYINKAREIEEEFYDEKFGGQ